MSGGWRGRLVVLLIAVLAGFAGQGVSSSEKKSRSHRTFSILAYDPQRQEWGVATASKALAVGAGVPWAEAGVGAVATQSATNVTYGPRGLKLLAAGTSPARVVKLLTDDDEDREDRQLGIIDAQGATAHFTGKGCDRWAGVKAGKNYLCIGNLLKGQEVVDAMAEAFEKAKGPLAWRLMDSLEAGERAGGDRRGKQSAAIVVVRDKIKSRTRDDRVVDFRVDDHIRPVQELARILALEWPRPKAP